MSRPKLKVKKGDRVVVIAGGDKGKRGEVLSVSRMRTGRWCRASTWWCGISSNRRSRKAADRKRRRSTFEYRGGRPGKRGGIACRLQNLGRWAQVGFAKRSGETIMTKAKAEQTNGYVPRLEQHYVEAVRPRLQEQFK